MHIDENSKKRSLEVIRPANNMTLRLFSAERATVAQHDSTGAISIYVLLSRR